MTRAVDRAVPAARLGDLRCMLLAILDGIIDGDGQADALHHGPVSYTHLTLPTSDLVEISVVAVSLKKKNSQSKRATSLLIH